jgi:serine/threonine-protein kinase ULK4
LRRVAPWTFEALATNGRLATVLINSGLTGLFSTMLRTCAHSSLKLRLATLLALLLRHTTYVQAKLARNDLLTTLAGATRDRDAKVRRRATAALGELVFYIAVQQQQQQQQQQRSPRQTCHSSGSASLAGDGTPDEAEWAQPWTPPPPVPQALLSALLPTEEPTTSHYAAKALENVFAASVAAPEGSIAHVLGTAATLTSLVRLATSTAAPEPVRITAAAAAAQQSSATMRSAIDRRHVLFKNKSLCHFIRRKVQHTRRCRHRQRRGTSGSSTSMGATGCFGAC